MYQMDSSDASMLIKYNFSMIYGLCSLRIVFIRVRYKIGGDDMMLKIFILLLNPVQIHCSIVFIVIISLYTLLLTF